MSSDTKLLVLNIPHNPTGWTPTLKELKEIISICEKNGVFIFCDEMYHKLWLNNELLSMIDLYEVLFAENFLKIR